MSGYTPCACETCMDIAISNDHRYALCWACKEAGCDAVAGSPCARTDFEDEQTGENDGTRDEEREREETS